MLSGRVGAILWLALLALGACAAPGGKRAPASGADAATAPDYRQAIPLLEAFIRAEMEDKRIPALSIALVDGERIVWARGFGVADPGSGEPATAESVWRVGSVSKLVTDIALMQLVERGEVDLDAPVSRWLPELSAGSPAGRATLRQLLSHQAGIVREPPVGHYFATDSPALAGIAASMDSTPAVFPPGERTKYSNAGVALVGRVIERVTGRAFAEHVRESVLRPAGMSRSEFAPAGERLAEVPRAWMWAYDRPDWPAPTFPLATVPAGGLYAPVTDLARLLAALFAGGVGPGGRLVEEATLEGMWTVQLGPEGARSGFGLGFFVSELDGHLRVGHGGWVYGFGTELAGLPGQRLGVAVAANVDGSNAVVERIAERALRLALAARAGEPPSPAVVTDSVPADLARRLEGRYGRGRRWLELEESGGALSLLAGEGGLRRRARRIGDTLVTDGRFHFGTRLLPVWPGAAPGPEEGRTGAAAAPAEGSPAIAVVVCGDTLPRLADSLPAPLPPGWLELIGEYGWEHDVLYVLERAGRLHLLIEWFFYEPLEPAGPDRFRLPEHGLYAGESVEALRSPDGGVRAVRVGGVVFPRRAVGPGEGRTFRIHPLRPVEELRPAALAADPPADEGDLRLPELVELASLDPTIRYDIRYATENNFMGAVFYPEARALLQRPAGEALARAHRSLARHGFGLLIHDAYRPWHVTKMFWDATPEELKLFVADPAYGSRHNRGAAVDLTLYDLETAEPVEMPSGYDEFTDRAFADYPGGTERQRALRELLREAMEAEGFEVYGAEWWHFDYRGWRDWPILNLDFEELAR